MKVKEALHDIADATEKPAQSLDWNFFQILAQTDGIDMNSPGLTDTPSRARKSWNHLTSGYGVDIKGLVGDAIFDEVYDEMVVVKDIEFYSLCEHHLLPFFGVCHVGYVPRNRIIGLSKIPRIVDAFSRRLQVQERLTKQIACSLTELLDPSGVAVVIEASHLCVRMRGIGKQGSTMTTNAMYGVFRDNAEARTEFMSSIKG